MLRRMIEAPTHTKLLSAVASTIEKSVKMKAAVTCSLTSEKGVTDVMSTTSCSPRMLSWRWVPPLKRMTFTQFHDTFTPPYPEKVESVM